MKTLHFSVTINAPQEHVWNTMLEDTTYREWTATFMPGSHYVGRWEAGSNMQFLSPDEDGKMTGLKSRIVAVEPPEFVSIKHLGIVSNGVEDTTSEEAKQWVGFENYTFKMQGGSTKLLIDVDSNDDFADYLNEAWPKALQKLKAISEGSL